MAKKVINKVVNPVAKPVTEVVKEDNEVVKVVKEEVAPTIPTIFDKYRKHIDTVKEGYLKKLSYAEAIEMLRYIQKNTNHKLGLNMSCSNCLVELVQIFASLEGK